MIPFNLIMKLMSPGAAFIPPVTSARSPARRGQAPNGATMIGSLLIGTTVMHHLGGGVMMNIKQGGGGGDS